MEDTNMGNGRSKEITLGTGNSASDEFGQGRVASTLGCRGTQAYLLLAAADGKPIALVQMTWDEGT
jgi:hypothetical protein